MVQTQMWQYQIIACHCILLQKNDAWAFVSYSLLLELIWIFPIVPDKFPYISHAEILLVLFFPVIKKFISLLVRSSSCLYHFRLVTIFRSSKTKYNLLNITINNYKMNMDMLMYCIGWEEITAGRIKLYSLRNEL